ncbi:MAG TPA: SBBP repeat-containing protein [Blastocatellia bacterium]|nr:SBBP repeat-containing protein [Blastocatellia bacterium]
MTTMSRKKRIVLCSAASVNMLILALPFSPVLSYQQLSARRTSAQRLTSSIAKSAAASISAGIEPLDLTGRETGSRLNFLAQSDLCFEPNQGQARDEAHFVCPAASGKLLLSPTEAIFANNSAGITGSTNGRGRSEVRMRLVNGDLNSEMCGVGQLVTRANYLIGNDPSRWRTGIPTFSCVESKNVYPGIDVDYYGNHGELEYDFIVAPGADPGRIQLRFEGVERQAIDPEGNLVLTTGAGDLVHRRPLSYQASDGVRREIRSAYRLADDGVVSLELGDYDRNKELTIDPILAYSMYFGGSLAETGNAVVVDSSGMAYIAGDSRSSDFTHGSADNSDVFVGKLIPGGGVLTYIFFGGTSDDFGTGVAFDADGNLYLAGSTQSDDFPMLNSVNQSLLGTSDAFVTKFSPGGDQFLLSTLIGGGGEETHVSMALDSARNIYVTGKTTSTDFVTTGAIQPAFGGGDSDAFAAKISADGLTTFYATYVGGSGDEDTAGGTGIAVDADGNAFITGDTKSADFPTKNALQGTKGAGASVSDAFLTKINPAGSDVVYSTFMGGAGEDAAFGVAVDSLGEAFVAGRTSSLSFPGSSSSRSPASTSDGFVARLNATGMSYLYLTFVGGSANDEINGVAVDSLFVASIAGTAGPGLPTIRSIQSYFAGGETDLFVATLSPTGTITFATYLGGTGNDKAGGVAVDEQSAIYAVGTSDSADYPASIPVFRENAGGKDLIISKIDPVHNHQGPHILKVTIDGNQLNVFGQNFDSGAVIRVNDVPKGTKSGSDATQILISKKGAKKIKPGRTAQVQVENSSGKRSNLFFVTRPM